MHHERGACADACDAQVMRGVQRSAIVFFCQLHMLRSNIQLELGDDVVLDFTHAMRARHLQQLGEVIIGQLDEQLDDRVNGSVYLSSKSA